MNVEIVRTDDWEAVSVDGTIVAEGHDLREGHFLNILRALGFAIPEGLSLSEICYKLGHKVRCLDFESDEDAFREWERRHKRHPEARQ